MAKHMPKLTPEQVTRVLRRPMDIPTRTVFVPAWDAVCDWLESTGSVSLKCTSTQSRLLYQWAKAHRGYRVSTVEVAEGVMVVRKQANPSTPDLIQLTGENHD